jgi:single-stranded-DNA-specific exonuclease
MGRLADMSLGIACLLEDDAERAAAHASQLDTINRERRRIEADMNEQAAQWVARWNTAASLPAALVLHDASFHEGVVGIVAGRVKDALHRPTFVFALAADGTLKGSGRSVAGVHLRDALDAVSKQAPGLLVRFGGHAMAAGCTLVDGRPDTLQAFERALIQAVEAFADQAWMARKLLTDGPLASEDFALTTVAAIDAQVWGQAFEAPVFCDVVEVINQRVVADKHLKLRVRRGASTCDAIWFGHLGPVAERVRMAYRLAVDDHTGVAKVQMIVEAIEMIEVIHDIKQPTGIQA